MRLLAVAVEGEAEGTADGVHSAGSQSRNPLHEDVLWDGDQVMEINRAWLLHSVQFIDQDFAGKSTPRSGDWRHSDFIHRRD